ncbi:sensor histidine kinase [Janibacter corallicola]|uniref:sensor histidine kinase n=1 Tax=Janibacter corallicola TaxID=415212 RepID=UPI000834C7E5|nr:ATP-binding protein [Janibacter corallicola]
MRESAARTASDLRSLLSVLRRPDDPDLAAAVPGLDAVPGLVDESIEAGMPLVATVRIEGESGLDPFVGQTAHRITQELLTNARRHAPGAGVRLAFVARPADGVTIEVANRRREQSAHVEGGGLTGVRERAARVDGEAHVTVDDEGNFRVAVRLPWRQAQRMEPR